jgi:hypothetical protein
MGATSRPQVQQARVGRRRAHPARSAGPCRRLPRSGHGRQTGPPAWLGPTHGTPPGPYRRSAARARLTTACTPAFSVDAAGVETPVNLAQFAMLTRGASCTNSTSSSSSATSSRPARFRATASPGSGAAPATGRPAMPANRSSPYHGTPRDVSGVRLRRYLASVRHPARTSPRRIDV